MQPCGLLPARLLCPWEFPEYWSGLLCPPPGDLLDPGIKLVSLMSPALAGGFFTTRNMWDSLQWQSIIQYKLSIMPSFRNLILKWWFLIWGSYSTVYSINGNELQFIGVQKLGQNFMCTYVVWGSRSVTSIRFLNLSKVTDCKTSASIISHTNDVFTIACFPAMLLTFI